MPRKSTEFIKLETRILTDYRFLLLGDFEQLLYLKLMILARITDNKIPRKLEAIEAVLRTKREPNDIELTLKRLKSIFPKFKCNKHFYYFVGYTSRFHKRFPIKNRYAVRDIDIDIDKDVRGRSPKGDLKKETKKWNKEPRFEGSKKDEQ